MRSDLLDYDLPPHLIAQQPCAERDQARLLLVRRSAASIAHYHFHELPELLSPGDLVVLNDTRVLPARLLGRRGRTGGRWEGLFLVSHPDGSWELLCQTRGRLIEGETILVEPGPLQLCLVGKTAEGHWLAEPSEPGLPVDLLPVYGQVPLPPYIRRARGDFRARRESSSAADSLDRERYQTMYARTPGSVAAPTAGLHFTPRVFEGLARRGIDRAFVTLHVGLGTFLPIQATDVTQHHMHREWAELPAAAAKAITACKARGGRVVAVGTTSVRLLETAVLASQERERPELAPWSGETSLFIYPPYQFRVVDALLTNFHLTRSTLLLLVAAFAGVELTRQAYKTAVEQAYRFFSYGDAMLIV
jgi:S-adenosylmethionine:tRNA ribosyltransferase-isomerase